MKKIIIPTITTIVIAIGAFLFLNQPNQTVDEITHIIDKQNSLTEQYINDLMSNQYTIEDPKVILNPYEISPLTALIMFTTTEDVSVQVTVPGKDNKTTLDYIVDNGIEKMVHYIPVFGLYAGTANKIEISLSNGTKTIVEIKTDNLDENITLPISVINTELASDGFTFVTPTTKSNQTAAFDNNGDLRWYLDGRFPWDIKMLNNGNLLISSNRSMNPPYYTVGLMEMNFLGKITREYTLPGGYHHDVFELENGNLLVASENFDTGYVEDLIVEVERNTGHVINSWDLKNILPMDNGQSGMWTEYDWFHNNSIWFDDQTNSIILSGRHQDAVISIDYYTKELNWIIGDNTNWNEDMQQYFFTPIGKNFEWQWGQHAAMVLPDGSIFLFDNGNYRSKIESEYLEGNDNYSRGVIYSINTSDMTIEQTFEYGKERGYEYYSPYISDVDYFNDGHYLVHSGGTAIVDGVALTLQNPSNKEAEFKSYTTEIIDGDVVFELVLPGNYYRAEKIKMDDYASFSLDKGKILGRFSETLTIENNGSLLFTNNGDSIIEEHNIEIYKETDRLVFEGTFVEATNVNIILDNVIDRKTYDVIVAKRPYTAMCIDIFNLNTDTYSDEINIVVNINDTNMSGTYNIFLEINGEKYNLNKSVTFSN